MAKEQMTQCAQKGSCGGATGTEHLAAAVVLSQGSVSFLCSAQSASICL